jgi:hypothetical protein
MIWFRSDRYKCDFEYFRICLKNRLFNLKRSWGGVMLWFVPKNYFDTEFSRNNYFCKQNARKLYSDARFSPIKIAFFLLHGWNHSPPFKLKGRFLTRFHYYIFFYLGMDAMVFSVATVKLLLGFIEWNLYLMWSSVNCRHNVRHIRTIPFPLPPDWDFYDYKLSISLPMWNLKLCQQLKHEYNIKFKRFINVMDQNQIKSLMFFVKEWKVDIV